MIDITKCKNSKQAEPKKGGERNMELNKEDIYLTIDCVKKDLQLDGFTKQSIVDKLEALADKK